MNTSLFIGNITLNISFALYLVFYLPQLIHNQKTEHIAYLSLNMHAALYLGYVIDLLYGFSNNLPWQYLMVSSVGCVFLTIQHLQITRYFYREKKHVFTLGMLGSIVLMACFIIDTIIRKHVVILHIDLAQLGWVSQLLFAICFLPQCIKNIQTRTQQALSGYFLALNIVTTCLDLSSAWCLNWGWPNKIGPVFILIFLILLIPLPTEKNAASIRSK